MFCAVSTGVSTLAMAVQSCYRHEQMHISKGTPPTYAISQLQFLEEKRAEIFLAIMKAK
jgi:hypothetical protein